MSRVVSASAFEDDRRQALAAGASDFMGKPFRESELLEKLRAGLGIEYVWSSPACHCLAWRHNARPFLCRTSLPRKKVGPSNTKPSCRTACAKTSPLIRVCWSRNEKAARRTRWSTLPASMLLVLTPTYTSAEVLMGCLGGIIP